MTIENSSPVEVAYTLAMLVAFVYSLWNCLWARDRLREVAASADNAIPLMVLRKGARNDQGRIAVMSLCQVVIGVVSMLSPPATGTPNPGAIVSALAFLVLSAMTLWLTIAIRIRPNQILRSARKDKGGP